MENIKFKYVYNINMYLNVMSFISHQYINSLMGWISMSYLLKYLQELEQSQYVISIQ